MWKILLLFTLLDNEPLGSHNNRSKLSCFRLCMSQFRHSSDILDRLPRSQPARSRIDQVEPGLFLGNMDAATDILSLEAHRISHIVTVDYLHILQALPYILWMSVNKLGSLKMSV